MTAGVVFLIALMVAISLGSTLFHTFADTTTRWLDVIPIAAFITAYLWIYLRRVLGSSAMIATICSAIFILAAVVSRQFPEVLNGSVIYAPALVLVVGLGLIDLATRRREKGVLIGAAAIFIAALGFRAIDNSVCAAFPVGTHFLWHLLTALSLYLAMRALVAGWSFHEDQPGSAGLSRNGVIA
jgi:hypothetical protein